MNCQEFRRALGADPNFVADAAAAHRESCAECRRYADEMQKLNGLIERALKVPVPETRMAMRTVYARTPSPADRYRAKWFAVAASAVLAFSVVFGLVLLGTPRESLASDVIAHLAHEPQAMTPSTQRIAGELLDGALRAKGLRLATPLPTVSYLQSCELRGHFVPHLVLQTARGPVTVMILPDETIAANETLSEGPYRGVLVPAPKGALAVIATDAVIVEEVVKTIRAAIVWQ